MKRGRSAKGRLDTAMVAGEVGVEKVVVVVVVVPVS